MLLTIKGKKADITPELQQLLRENPPINVKKPVISKKKTKDSEFVSLQEIDDNGIGKTIDGVYDIYPKVYFDSSGRYYLNVFRSMEVEHEGEMKEVLVTNPGIKTKEDCNLYAKGEKSHVVPIPGSENWADGRADNYVHYEALSKGKPEYKIVLTLTRDEVLAVELKPQGESLSAKIANSTDAEKKFMLEQLLGKEVSDKILSIPTNTE